MYSDFRRHSGDRFRRSLRRDLPSAGVVELTAHLVTQSSPVDTYSLSVVLVNMSSTISANTKFPCGRCKKLLVIQGPAKGGNHPGHHYVHVRAWKPLLQRMLHQTGWVLAS